jgi:hypothetical protein
MSKADYKSVGSLIALISSLEYSNCYLFFAFSTTSTSTFEN